MDTNNTDSILQVKDPGTMGNKLLSVPGFVNELKNYTLAVSPRPNPPLAFAGALAMLAHLTGRSYVDEQGGHTNLYLAALAPTAMGKEEPRDTNKKLADAVGALDSVPDAVASGEGLEDAVTETPEAKSVLKELRLRTDDISSQLFEADMRTTAALCCRLYEKAKKLAVLWAISEKSERTRDDAGRRPLGRRLRVPCHEEDALRGAVQPRRRQLRSAEETHDRTARQKWRANGAIGALAESPHRRGNAQAHHPDAPHERPN